MNIPGFEIHSVLGEGGMATVYLAEQVSLGRQVALKVMAKLLVATDSDFCQRFVNEGRIIAKLRHPHIVTIHDIGCTDDGTYFMSMEYCPGGTLKERISSSRSRIEPLSMLRQIASALGYAHDHGFIHRDVKPGNILFRDDDSVALSDFGIAKTVDANTRVTREGWAIGTPEYMSPEQASGKELTPSADLYSLGVVLFEMLAGRKPYHGPDPLAIAMQHASAPIPRLPPEYLSLQHLLDGLLAKKPDERFHSADELIAEIEALERAQPRPRDDDATRILGAAPRTDPNGMTAPLPASATRPKRRLAAGLVAGIGVAAAVGWLAYERLAEAPQSQPAGPTPAAVVPNATGPSPHLPPAVAARVGRLLETAQVHVAVGRLCGPVGSSARDAYSLVVELDPDNDAARRALQELEASCAAQ